MRKNAPAGTICDFPRTPRSEPIKVERNLLAVFRYQHLPIWLQKKIDALPAVGEQARSGSGGLKHAGRRWKPVSGHSLPIHVQCCEPRAKKRILSVGAHMGDALHVAWKFFGFASRSPQQKPLVWHPTRGIEAE